MAETPRGPGAGGGFQSRLRPLVLLLERVLRHLLWGVPYTPKPSSAPCAAAPASTSAPSAPPNAAGTPRGSSGPF